MLDNTESSDLQENEIVATFTNDSRNPVTISVNYWDMPGANRHSGYNS